MRYMGIDPGDRWCGYAVLDTMAYRCKAEMGVLDVTARSFARTVDQLNSWMPDVVAIESFQQRPVGHQRFASAETPQMIGALKYVFEKASSSISVVPPGDPLIELGELGLARYIQAWRKLSGLRNPRWQHADSAWRILGRYLMTHETRILMMMRTGPTWKSLAVTTQTEFAEFSEELRSSKAYWTLHRKGGKKHASKNS